MAAPPAEFGAVATSGRSRVAARVPGWVAWTVPVIVFTLLRVPTLLEPHWYTDEAGYAVTAWLAMHGHTLYGSVWNNKPPLLFWTYGLILTLFGPSEAALHCASWLSGLVAVAAVYAILRRPMGPVRAGIGAAVAALLLGTPLLNGDLALPENFLVGPSALGILALLRADDAPARAWLGWTVGAGVCFAAAALFQQTALDVIAAGALWLVVRRGRGGSSRVAVLLGTITVLVAAALAPYAIWVGPRRLVFLLVTTYSGYAGASLAPTLANVGVRAVEVLALLAGAVAARRMDRWRLLIWLWAGAALIVATLPNRPYPHLGLPTVAPLAILLASVPLRLRLRWPAGRQAVTRAGQLLLGVAVLLPLGIGWSLLSPPGAFYSLALTGHYYQSFIGRATGAVAPASYRVGFGAPSAAMVVAARWLRAHGYAGSSSVIWSTDAWADLLVPLRPQLITPTVYMNEYWLGAAAVIRRVEQGRPRVILADATGLAYWPSIKPVLHRSYRLAYTSGAVTVWVRGRR